MGSFLYLCPNKIWVVSVHTKSFFTRDVLSNKNKKRGRTTSSTLPYTYGQNYIQVLFEEMCEIIDHMAHIVCKISLLIL